MSNVRMIEPRLAVSLSMPCAFFVPGAALRTARSIVGDWMICQLSIGTMFELSASPATHTLPARLNWRVGAPTAPQRSS